MVLSLFQLSSMLRIRSVVRTVAINNLTAVAYLSTAKAAPTSPAVAAAAPSKPSPPAAAAKPSPPAPASALPAENEISPITERREKMSKMSNHLIYYNEHAEKQYLPAPTLPENLIDLSALDPSDALFHNVKEDGTKRRVYICQMEASIKQASLNREMMWRIFFYDDGTSSERWENPLMGWTSNADPYQSNPPITFETAADAVYFAKKNNWHYHVHHPITRVMRNDNAQYQDNFLPQAVVLQLEKEGTRIKEWERSFATTSHYFRPLNYHGTAPVRQHGPTGTTVPIAPHVASTYKTR